MKSEYFSMWEASKLCSYSQEYLSLLSRRKLLQAKKIGNKWFTTIEWLNDYLREKKPGEVVVRPLEPGEFSPQKKWALATGLILGLVGIVGIFDSMSSKITSLDQERTVIATSAERKVQVGDMFFGLFERKEASEEIQY